MLPNVTGTNAFAKWARDNTPGSAGVRAMWDQRLADANSLIRRPSGTKYMFTTECSNPAATNAEIGKSTARILSAVERAPTASHTARQTRTLQRIPRKNALSNGRDTLATAILRATVA